MRIVLSLLLLNTLTVSSTEQWKDIIPLKSTRADVERLLGPPPEPQTSTYILRNETVHIFYAKYGCNPAPVVPGWPTPPIENGMCRRIRSFLSEPL